MQRGCLGNSEVSRRTHKSQTYKLKWDFFVTSLYYSSTSFLCWVRGEIPISASDLGLHLVSIILNWIADLSPAPKLVVLPQIFHHFSSLVVCGVWWFYGRLVLELNGVLLNALRSIDCIYVIVVYIIQIVWWCVCATMKFQCLIAFSALAITSINPVSVFCIQTQNEKQLFIVMCIECYTCKR